jgi:hypothetical protein
MRPLVQRQVCCVHFAPRRTGHTDTPKHSKSSAFNVKSVTQGMNMTYLLNVHSDKEVLNCSGEVQASSITARRLPELPQEEILVHHVECKEGGARKAIDDGRYDRVAQG